MATLDLPSGRLGFQQLAQTGRGPARDVVMVHGLGANFGFWYASAVQWFRRFGRVTLLDLPGHGTSAMPVSGYTPRRLAEVLGELFDHLGIESGHLVAHSFGGAVALAFAIARPERVQSLVLADVRLWCVEPPAPPDPTAPWLQKLRSAGLTLDTRRDPSVQLLVELAQERLLRDDPDALIHEALPGARSLFPGKRSAKRWLELIETTSAYAEMTDPDDLALADIARLEQPILAVYGGHSTRKRSAQALHRACPHARLQVIPDVGHFFPLTRPRLFARPALAFLRTLERDKALARRHNLTHAFRSEDADTLAATEAGESPMNVSLVSERGDDGPATLLVEEPLPLVVAKSDTAEEWTEAASDEVQVAQGIARPHIVH